MGPVFFRLILIIVLGLACAGLTNPYWGMGVVILGFFAEILMHLNYIARLAHWLDDSVSVTRADAAEVPDAAMGLWADIFARVYKTRRAFDKNARRLEEREARYKKTLGALPEGILLLKRDWVLSWCNANAEAIFGVSGENDVGRHVFALVPDETLVAYLKAGHYETPLIWPKVGTDKTYEIRVVVADRKNALLIARDVTEQEKLDAMRRDFVANVSHELKTPMTTIGGFIDGITDGTIPPDKAPHYLEIVSAEVHRLSRLVSKLLLATRLQSGMQDLNITNVDISSVVSSVVINAEQAIEDKHLDVDIDLPDARCFVRGDEDALTQVVTNLIDNAVKYGNEGGKISVTVSERNDKVLVSVFNTGKGIAKEQLPFIFDRFYKADRSRGMDKSSTGLGLYIVKSILNNLHQEIVAESEYGHWVRFTFTLEPAKRGGKSQSPSKSALAKPEQ